MPSAPTDDEPAVRAAGNVDAFVARGDVSFAFQSALVKMNESGGPVRVTIALKSFHPTLPADVSVEVYDLGTGTATSGSDYVAFAPRRVFFPAGSLDQATQVVWLDALDDAVVEAPGETIRLGLRGPYRGMLQGTTQLTLTIEDDDLAGDAAIQASEGTTGVENELAQDELVSLGTQSIGTGPNAGTLLRITNVGGQPMDLGTPSLTGIRPSDFALEVESSSLVPGFGNDGKRALSAAAESIAPLAALASDRGPGVALQVDHAELARIRAHSAVTLHGIALPELGPVALELTRRPLPIAADAKLVIDGAEVAGGPRTLLGGLSLWSGRVAGVEGSRVFLAFRGDEVQGFVRLPQPADGFVHVFPDGAGRVRFVSEPELLALGARLPDEFCAGERFAPGASPPPALVHEDPDTPSTSALTIASCRLALETDYQLYDKFDSSVLLTSYVTSQIAAISEQYATDVQTTLSIAYLGIHTTADDGWDTQEVPGGDAFDLLTEFRTAWANRFPVPADLAHFLSGDSLGGGAAYVNVLCNQSVGFAVSGSLRGTIDWINWNGEAASFTWDFVVTAHELGHNFGSSHTHSYCPPLDECPPSAYWGPCQDELACERGTIMSYCHITCGGMSNIDLHFHPVTANLMRQRVNSSCLGQAALSPGDYVQYRLRFNPLDLPPGPRSATLTFPHDAPNAPQPFRVQLSGTAR